MCSTSSLDVNLRSSKWFCKPLPQKDDYQKVQGKKYIKDEAFSSTDSKGRDLKSFEVCEDDDYLNREWLFFSVD